MNSGGADGAGKKAQTHSAPSLRPKPVAATPAGMMPCPSTPPLSGRTVSADQGSGLVFELPIWASQ